MAATRRGLPSPKRTTAATWALACAAALATACVPVPATPGPVTTQAPPKTSTTTTPVVSSTTTTRPVPGVTTTAAPVTSMTPTTVATPPAAAALTGVALSSTGSGPITASVRFTPVADTNVNYQAAYRLPGGTWTAHPTIAAKSPLAISLPTSLRNKSIELAVRTMPASATSCTTSACSAPTANATALTWATPTIASAPAQPETLGLTWAAWTGPFVRTQAKLRAPVATSFTNAGPAVTTPQAAGYTYRGLVSGATYGLGVEVTQKLVPLVTGFASATTTTLGWDPYSAANFAGAQVSIAPVPTDRPAFWASPTGTGTTCTSTSPCALSTAIAQATAGSTVVVKGGTYEAANLGVLRRQIRLMAQPGDSPVLKGTATITGAWSATTNPNVWSRDLLATGWPAIPTWAQIPTQTTADRPEADDPEQLILDGVFQRQIDPTQWGTAPGKFYVDSTGGATPLPAGRFFYEATIGKVYVGSATNPGGRRVEWSKVQRAIKIAPQAAGTSIVGISFLNYSPYHGNALAAVEVIANDVTLQDVTVRYSAATGIVGAGRNSELTGPLHNMMLRRVTATDNGALGASLGDGGPSASIAQRSENDLKIEFSRFDTNNREYFDYETCNRGNACVLAGVKVARLDGFIVRYSSFANNRSSGFWADLFCQEGTIVGNSFRDNVRSGVFYEVSRSGNISGNVFAYNNTSGSDSGAGVKVTGGGADAPDGTNPGLIKVTRNTFVANLGAQVILGYDVRSSSGGNPGWQIGKPQIASQGNLFVEGAQGTEAGGRRIFRTIVGDLANLDAGWVTAGVTNRNHFVLKDDATTSPVTRYVWGSTIHKQVRQFSAATGSEVNSTLQVRAQTDPSLSVFVNPAKSNFVPVLGGAGSTSIGGVATTGWATANLDSAAAAELLGPPPAAGTGAPFAATTPRS